VGWGGGWGCRWSLRLGPTAIGAAEKDKKRRRRRRRRGWVWLIPVWPLSTLTPSWTTKAEPAWLQALLW